MLHPETMIGSPLLRLCAALVVNVTMFPDSDALENVGAETTATLDAGILTNIGA